jgi:hypothetical protein
MPPLGNVANLDHLIGRELREQLNVILKDAVDKADWSRACAPSINLDGTKVLTDSLLKSASPIVHRQLLEALRSAGGNAEASDGKVVGALQLDDQKVLMIQMDQLMEQLTAVMSQRADLAQKAIQNIR